MPLHVDTIINERYRVIRALGEGGMGAAHLVEDQRLGRQCVIKEVLSDTTDSQKQFLQEAKILAQLRHPHLPAVHDFFTANGTPYLVMEFIPGTTLDKLQAGQSILFETAEVLRWARDLLNALQYMHDHDPPVIHRDIKPSNVCISPDGKAMLLDFGIARHLDETQTRTEAQRLSTGYAPIEQYPENEIRHSQSIRTYWTRLREAGIHTGPYSDIYGLGATLYFALTLLRPPPAPMRIFSDEIEPVKQHNPHAPDYLAEAVMKALAIHPEERFQSAAEMLAALQPDAAGAPVVRLRPRPARPLPTGSVTALDQTLIYIPAGEFLMGSHDPELKDACRPQHQVDLGPYCIGRCPVTNADYQRFIENNPAVQVPYSALRVAQPYNWDRRSRTFPRGLEDHPVVLVNWPEALAYCRWLSEVSGYRCRLPSEAEWEKAAAWDPAPKETRAYPWGRRFDDSRCNVDAHGALRLKSSPVGHYSPGGDSPYGLADMAGNVWEWTGSLYRPYPYAAGDGREASDNTGQRVVRGGAFDETPLLAHCAWRHSATPDLHSHNIGFRVACGAA